jgi:polysaccharide biosynthesis/export protein
VKYLLLLTCLQCLAWADDAQQPKWEVFKPAVPKDGKVFTSQEVVDRLNASVPEQYLLGPGDILNIQVWQQPELSGQRTLGPDGVITMPLVGDLALGATTRDVARNMVESAVSRFYKDPIVTLEVSEYHNNNIFVLGHLAQPGLMSITGRGTLLEAITQVPLAQGVQTSLSKCALIRGADTIVWVDLRAMLREGDLRLNLKLANNDILYLPDEEEANIYVMGEVQRPGAYRLKPYMSFLDALMTAGGATVHGRQNHVELIRREPDGKIHRLRLKAGDLRRGNFTANVELKENDVIYVGRKPLAHINYLFSSLSPLANILLIQDVLADDE